MTFCRALCVLLVLPALVWAQIPRDALVSNRAPGVCWFACAETAGRIHGVEALYGLTDKVLSTGVGKDGASDEVIHRWLKHLGVRYYLQNLGDKDWKWVKAWNDYGSPVVLSVQNWKGISAHALLLLKISPEGMCTVYDCNDRDTLLELSAQALQEHWNGRAVVIEHRRQASQKAPVTVKQPTVPVVQLGQPAVHPLVLGNQPLREVRLPSNQDIKDGVNRPLDEIDTIFYPVGPDYLKILQQKKTKP